MKKPRKFWVVCFADGFPVAPMDCNEEYDGKISDEGMLVYRTKGGAVASANHQTRLYDLPECHARPLDKAVFAGRDRRENYCETKE